MTVGNSVVAVERRTYPTTPVMWRKRSSTGFELKRKTPLVAAIGYVAKGWVAAFRRNGTNMRQKPGDIV